MTFQKEVSIQTKFEEVLSRRKLCIKAQQKKVHYKCLCLFFFKHNRNNICQCSIISYMKSILIKNISIFKILQEHQIKQLDLIPKRECKGNDRFSYSNFPSQEQTFFFLVVKTNRIGREKNQSFHTNRKKLRKNPVS